MIPLHVSITLEIHTKEQLLSLIAELSKSTNTVVELVAPAQAVEVCIRLRCNESSGTGLSYSRSEHKFAWQRGEEKC